MHYTWNKKYLVNCANSMSNYCVAEVALTVAAWLFLVKSPCFSLWFCLFVCCLLSGTDIWFLAFRRFVFQYFTLYRPNNAPVLFIPIKITNKWVVWIGPQDLMKNNFSTVKYLNDVILYICTCIRQISLAFKKTKSHK